MKLANGKASGSNRLEVRQDSCVLLFKAIANGCLIIADIVLRSSLLCDGQRSCARLPASPALARHHRRPAGDHWRVRRPAAPHGSQWKGSGRGHCNQWNHVPGLLAHLQLPAREQVQRTLLLAQEVGMMLYTAGLCLVVTNEAQ